MLYGAFCICVLDPHFKKIFKINLFYFTKYKASVFFAPETDAIIRFFLKFLNDFILFWESSVGKESTCNAGDPGSIPGLGRSAGEEIG